MKAAWKAFLQKESGAVIENDRILHFGNPAHELQIINSGAIYTDLSDLGLISAQGDDALSFLQNLTVNDVSNVSQERSQLSAICTPKGRVIANFRLFMRNHTYYLQLPASMLELTLKRLRMYILRSKVTLADASDSLLRIGCSGPNIDKELAQHIGHVPEQVDDAVQHNTLNIIRMRGPTHRFEIIGELDDMKRLWQKLNVRAAPTGVDAWRLLNIQAGIPTIYPQTSEAFIPQMLNFQAINSLSFTKGCYPGQEIVARTQYLGKVKRHMYLAHTQDDIAPQPGDEIFCGQEGIGKVVDAHASPNGGYALLAVIQGEDVSNLPLKMKPDSATGISIDTLPYDQQTI